MQRRSRLAAAALPSALLTLDYLAERAKYGNRAAFEEVLKKVQSRSPVPGDEWPGAGVVEPHARSQRRKARRAVRSKAMRKK